MIVCSFVYYRRIHLVLGAGDASRQQLDDGPAPLVLGTEGVNRDEGKVGDVLLRPGGRLGWDAQGRTRVGSSGDPGASGGCGLWPESVWNCSLPLLSSHSASWLMSVKCDKGNAAQICDLIIKKKTFQENTAIK